MGIFYIILWENSQYIYNLSQFKQKSDKIAHFHTAIS